MNKGFVYNNSLNGYIFLKLETSISLTSINKTASRTFYNDSGVNLFVESLNANKDLITELKLIDNKPLYLRGHSFNIDKINRILDLTFIRKNDTEYLVEVKDVTIQTNQFLLNLKYQKEIEEKTKAYKSIVLQLDNKNSRLERINAHLQRLSYISSHDLKSPLRSINNLITFATEEIAEENYSESIHCLQKAEKSIKKMYDSILSVNEVIQTILNSESTELLKKEESLDEIILEASNKYKNGNTVQFNLNLKKISFLCNKIEFQSVVENLISNSIKYKQKNIDPVISISIELKQSQIILIHRDNGKGIDLSKHKEDLFTMFKRFDSNVEGTGVGLFVLKEIIEQSYNGTINVESEINKGTEFTITVPIT